MLSDVCCRPGRGLFVMVAALALPTARAAAWTRTTVAAVEARVDVRATGEALVKLELGLRVDGGWLSSFELAPMDGQFVLDPDKPPSVLTEDGRKLLPVVKLESDGRLLFEFPDKREAPHRGLHRLALMYLARLPLGEATNAGMTRASVALPAWPVDLDAADIWVSAPAGSRFAPVEADEREAAIARERVDHRTRTLLHWHRVQLPRTSTLIAAFEMPSASVASSTPTGSTLSSTRDARRFALTLALMMAALVGLKRLSVARLARRHAAQPVPLLALPRWLAAALVPGLAVCAGLLHATYPTLTLVLLSAMVALGLHRGFSSCAPVAPLQAHAAGAGPRAIPSPLLSWTGWLDATTPLGLCLVSSLALIAGMRLALGGPSGLWFEGLLIVLPLWFNATHVELPRPRARHAVEPDLATADEPGPRPGLTPAGAAPQAQDRAA